MGIKKIRYINKEGKSVGIIPTEEALAFADKENLDLVLLQMTNSDAPIAKAMPYSVCGGGRGGGPALL